MLTQLLSLLTSHSEFLQFS